MTLRRAFELFRAIEPPRRLVAAAFAAMLVQGALGLLQPWPLKLLVDEVLGTGRWSLGAVLALGAAIAVGAAFAKAVYGRARTVLGMATVVALRNHLFAHLQRHSLAFHDRQRVGELASRLSTNTYALWTLTDLLFFTPAAALITLIGATGLMLRLDWRLGLVAIAIAPALFRAIRRYAERSGQVAREFHDAEGALAARTEETLSAVRVIQAFAREEDEVRRYASASSAIAEARLRMIDIDNRFALTSDLILAAGTLAILGLGAMSVREGRLTTGDLLLFVSYVGMLYSPLATLSYLAGSVSGSLASLARVAEVLDEHPDIRDRPDARPLAHVSGTVELRDVSFAHDKARSGLAHVSFTARAGELTAIIGPTGAGKSTLLALIPRFYDPTAGSITLDGQDLRDVQLRSLRESIAIVLQDSFLFDASVRENIAYGRPGATEAEILEAARHAQALEFIQKLPAGLDTRVGGRGVRLSGGERQRIAIARAFLKNAPILILDEPTASLDVETEAALAESLRALMRGRTTFLVTHRLTLAEKADRVLVVEDGTVREKAKDAVGV